MAIAAFALVPTQNEPKKRGCGLRCLGLALLVAGIVWIALHHDLLRIFRVSR